MNVLKLQGDASSVVKAVDDASNAFDEMAKKAAAVTANIGKLAADNSASMAAWVRAMNSVPKPFRAMLTQLINDQIKYDKALEKTNAGLQKFLQNKSRMATAGAFTASAQASLGGIPTGATPQALANLASAKRQVESLLVSGKVSKDRMQAMFDEIRRGNQALSVMTKEERQAEVALRRLTNAMTGMSQAGKRSQEILLTWRSALRILAIQQLHYGITAVTNQLVTGNREAAEFAVRIAEIQTITQRTAQSTGTWSNELTKLSNKFDLDLLDAAAAGYEAISNQVVNGATAANFLNTAFEFAQTTSSNAMQGVNLLSSAINGFNLSSFEADRIAAQFFKTIELGRVRTEQISNIFGNAAPMAHALGVSMEELNAGLAVLTRQGVRPDTSLTLLNNVILKLIKPSKEMSELFKEWGVNSGEAAIAAYGFEGVLKRLESEFQSGGLTRIGEIAQDMRAIRGQIGLLGGGAFDAFQESLQAITQGEKEYAKATELMSENTGIAIKRIYRELQNLFNLESGEQFNKIVVDFDRSSGGISKSIKPLLDAMINITKVTADLTAGFSAFSYGVNYWVPAGLALAGSYKLQGIGLTLVSAATQRYNLQLASLDPTIKASMTSMQALALRTGFLKASLTGTLVSSGLLTAAVSTMATLALPAAIGGITYLAVAAFEAKKKLSALADEISNELTKASESRLKMLTQTLTEEQVKTDEHIKQQLNKFNQYISGINLVIASFKPTTNLEIFALQQKIFEESLNGELLPTLDALNRKLTETTKLGTDFVNTEDFDNAKKIFEDIANSAEKINSRIQNTIDNIRRDIEKITGNKDDALLEAKLFGKSDSKRASILKREVEKVVESARIKEGQGLFEGALKDLERAEELSKRISGSKSNKGVFEQSNKLQIDIFEKQINLQKKYQEQLETRKISEVELHKSTFGFMESQNKAATEAAEAVKKLNDEYKSLETTLRKFREDLKSSKEEQSKLTGDFAGKAETINKLFQTGGEFQISGFGKGETATERYLDSLGLKSMSVAAEIEKLNKLQEKLQKAINTGDTAGEVTGRANLIEQFDKIAPSLEALRNFYKGQTFGNGSSLNLFLKETFDTVERLRQLQGKPEEFAAKITQNQQLLTLVDAKINESVNRMGNTLERFPAIFDQVRSTVVPAVEDINTKLLQTERLLRSLETFQQGKLNSLGANAVGGRFAQGGLLSGPMGRDNLLVRAHAGERIMNAEAEAKFSPVLASMNSNNRISSVGDTIIHVGGVSVNATAGPNGKLDVNGLGAELRRKIQQGVVKFK